MARGDLTLFDTFEYRGQWWLPEKPELKVPGVLTHTENRTTLDLFGSLLDKPLAQVRAAPEAEQPSLIIGQLDDGKCCTLYKPFPTSASYNVLGPKPTSSSWSVPCFIVGGGYFTVRVHCSGATAGPGRARGVNSRRGMLTLTGRTG